LGVHVGAFFCRGLLAGGNIIVDALAEVPRHPVMQFEAIEHGAADALHGKGFEFHAAGGIEPADGVAQAEDAVLEEIINVGGLGPAAIAGGQAHGGKPNQGEVVFDERVAGTKGAFAVPVVGPEGLGRWNLRRTGDLGHNSTFRVQTTWCFPKKRDSLAEHSLDGRAEGAPRVTGRFS